MKLVGFLLAIVLLSSCASKAPKNQDYMLLAVNWFQTAGEVHALQYQAYQAAKTELQKILRIKSKKPRAILFDIDETLLDNSPYQAKNILKNEQYPMGWKEWVLSAKAEAIPGSLEFVKYAKSKGVEIFYVSNRKLYAVDASYINLKNEGFPVKKDHLLFRDKTSSKEPRREQIRKDFNIVMLVGDNLGDFNADFNEHLYQTRNSEVAKAKKLFGRRYIVLPNPMYGDWEGAMSKGYFRAKDKDTLRKAVLNPM